MLLVSGVIILFGSAQSTSANEHLVQASITKQNPIYGKTATANWTGSWGGGNNTFYNIRFNYGDGNYASQNNATYKSRTFSRTFDLGSATYQRWNQSLVVHSGLSSYEATTFTQHYLSK
ncbi:hypothetical protein ACFVAD_23605 [Sutcliffiella sp. NPDC057660]|uniref:hypothetical protein n=1 Tax=Sutcliffiella sp. NPDC057660 TaxID=3346199 RepID=UPI003695983D